jgi:hypothetical protein
VSFCAAIWRERLSSPVMGRRDVIHAAAPDRRSPGTRPVTEPVV